MSAPTKHQSPYTLTMVILATLGAVAMLMSLVWATLGPAPARDVEFVGGWSEGEPTCHGPALWTGKVAYAACDWVYRRRALIRFDPEEARATVIHRWETDDGNMPELRVFQPCGDGQLFVIAETAQTRVITARGGRVSQRVAEVPGNDVLGAACREGAVDMFVHQGGQYRIVRPGDGSLERMSDLKPSDTPGDVLGAWLEGSAWHVVVRGQDNNVSVGVLGGELKRVATLKNQSCLVGAPGGWLFVAGRHGCWRGGTLISHAGDQWHATAVPSNAHNATVYSGGGLTAGYLQESDKVYTFGGLGALDFTLTRGPAFVASRSDGTTAAVAMGSYSSLETGAHALPLSGDRVAVWGGLGDQVVVMGPKLRRQDDIGTLARIVRPWGRFNASAKSTFDQICYFALLIATPLWGIALFLGRGKYGKRERWLRRSALTYLILFAICLWGFSRVAEWI